ncbi:MAG: YncE family protein [Luteimonas sp.]|nr:YncE family protein [Luteimonas sp.]
MTTMFRCLLPCLLLAGPALAQDELLVGNKSDDTVWRIGLEDGRKLGEFATGQGPHEIAVSADQRIALVTEYGHQQPGNTLSVVDTATGRVLRTVDLGKHTHPHGARVLAGGRRALVTTEDSGALLVVDIDKGKVERAIAVGEGRGHMVAVSPDGKTAYVSKIEAGTVSRIDLAAARKTDEVESGAGAEGIAVHRDGSVWVSNREAGTVTVHDPATLAVRRTLRSDGFPIRVAFTADGSRALVTNAKAAELAVFDTKDFTRVATVALDEVDGDYQDTMLGKAALPIGVIADPARPRVYVAISGGNEIAVIDTGSWKVVERWKTGKEPDALGIVAR